jgi:superfamily II DNA or RNA helicase
MIQLTHQAGTVVVAGPDVASLPGVQHDPRTNAFRAEGRFYRAIVEQLRATNTSYSDEARQWQATDWTLRDERVPFPHQAEAVETWWKHGGHGIVALPTGTGKTFAAILAIHKAQRPTLVVTPTIDLLHQWSDELIRAFGGPVGLLGGGHYDYQPLTVSTYDSAYIYLEQWAARFGLLVFDECHHLPGPSYSMIAIGSLAPFRLGLTATPERTDGADARYSELIGPIVYRREIQELSGDYLAHYRTERVYVDLAPDDAERYRIARETYRRFVDERRISMSRPEGLKRFLRESYRTAEGRDAFRAFREQKQLAQAAPAKLHKLAELLEANRDERILIFTADNATVYQIARQFLVPAITHQTKATERRSILERFQSGEYGIVVTSQVLNEGVDVPAASLGIILSGSGSVREHVQRLGRLLRKVADKQARLIEMVTRDTGEEFTSERRRQHGAYR